MHDMALPFAPNLQGAMQNALATLGLPDNTGTIVTSCPPRPPLPHEPPGDVLSLLSTPFVRDFLLSPSGASERAAVVAPHFLQNACTGTMNAHAQSLDGSTTGLESLSFQGTWIAVPMFICDGVTLVCILDETIEAEKGLRRPRCLHMAFRCSDGHALGVAHNPESGLSEMLVLSPPSTRRQVRRVLTFESKGLLRAYSSRDNAASVPDNRLLSNALRAAVIFNEHRSCIICGAAPDSDACNCTLAAAPPAHALDFAPFRQTFYQFNGSYTGECTSTTYNHGSIVQSRHCITFCTIRPVADPATIDHLMQWAQSGTSPESPSSTHIDLTTASQESTPEALSASLQSPFLDQLLNFVNPSVPLEKSIHPASMHVPMKNIQLPSSLSTQNSRPQFLMTSAQSTETSAAQEKNNVSSVAPPVPSATSTFPMLAPSDIPLPLSVPSLLPATVTASTVPPSAKTLKRKETREEILHRRVLRNRASAARCNLRKQMHLERLKTELAATSRKKTELQEREEFLRAENARLRKLVAA